jgi:SAM-dependent methyltransferase
LQPILLNVTPDQFFDLFLAELKAKPSLYGYYKFHTDPTPSKVLFRKRYFLQRLRYIAKQLEGSPKIVWDCGSGYATTAIYLTLCGHKVYGNTLEFYFDEIPDRLKYWSQFGDLSALELTYENHFDLTFDQRFDAVIAQDTLHHLEPIDEAIQIIAKALKSTGQLIAIEENGTNLVNTFKNYKMRGNKRIIELYDERLQRTILLGNENTRTYDHWKRLLAKQGLYAADESLDYVRLLWSSMYGNKTTEQLDKIENRIWRTNGFLRRFGYFGVSFVAKLR